MAEKKPYAKEDLRMWKELMKSKDYDKSMAIAKERGLLHQDQRSAEEARRKLNG